MRIVQKGFDLFNVLLYTILIVSHYTNYNKIRGGWKMGFFDGLMGNASEVNVNDIQNEFARILAPNEQIEKAYKLIRDLFLFTDKRLILVDKQGLTGKKVEFHSIPYKNITHFSIETAGNFDLDAELKIWLSGSATPIQKQFNKSLNIYELQSVLATYVLR